MAERRPIVIVEGKLTELPIGDTLPSTGGGSLGIFDGGFSDSTYAGPAVIDAGSSE